MPDEYESVGDEGSVIALNEITGALTVLGSSYQYTEFVVADPWVSFAKLYPSGDAALTNYGAWTMEAVALPTNIGDGS